MRRKGKKSRDDVEDIGDDPYSKERDIKEKKKFEDESKDYPVLGEDDDRFIVDTGKKKLFSGIKRPGKKIFSDFHPLEAIENHLPFRRSDKRSDKAREAAPEEEPELKPEKKFFMDGEDDTLQDDEFIVEGLDGVYSRDERDWGKIRSISLKVLGVTLAALFIFSLGFFFSLLFAPGVGGPCPYECCVDEDAYEDRLCPGLSECISNECVKPDCPEDFECCPGVLYEEKPCDDENHECSRDFQCVRKECPYECCTGADGYRERECANEGVCINNRCYLDPCPYECCVDEIEYDDKFCDRGKVCRDNECIPSYVDIMSRILRLMAEASRLIV